VASDETAESLEAKVTAAEPGLFVSTLKAIAEGRLKLPGGPKGSGREPLL
jgi:folate-dependent phosphoribosylglycinamide formyltransferase PurN